MPVGKFRSYRPKSRQNSLKVCSSYCPRLKRGPMRWLPFQCCVVVLCVWTDSERKRGN